MNKRKTELKHLPHFKFKGFLIENHISQRNVSKLLNLSPVTVNQKINGRLHFNFSEIEEMCNEYDIMPDIFLTRKLHKSNNNSQIE